MGSKLSITKFSPLGLRTKLSVMALIFGCCSKLSSASEDSSSRSGNHPALPSLQSGADTLSFDKAFSHTKTAQDAAIIGRKHHQGRPASKRRRSGTASAPAACASARSPIKRLEDGSQSTKPPAPKRGRDTPCPRKPDRGQRAARRRGSTSRKRASRNARPHARPVAGKRVSPKKTRSSKKHSGASKDTPSAAGAPPRIIAPSNIKNPDSISHLEKMSNLPRWNGAYDKIPERSPKTERARRRQEHRHGYYRGSRKRTENQTFDYPEPLEKFRSPTAPASGEEPTSPPVSRQGSSHGGFNFYSFDALPDNK